VTVTPNAPTALPPIPWSHETSDFGSVWRWQTPHFVVTVNGDHRSCYYQISDLTSGQDKPFDDGQAATFEQAEMLIRATIGKAYRPALGYQTYAGTLATTFTLGNGRAADLSPYLRQDTRVIVLDADNHERTYTGIASVEHYELLLANGDTIIRISPSHIIGIELNTAFANRATRPSTFTRTAGRTFTGLVEPGCTGTPGFLANTVDHTARNCPIHEDASN
jgi:hypothetical protein